jgi:hypothetical protein
MRVEREAGTMEERRWLMKATGAINEQWGETRVSPH